MLKMPKSEQFSKRFVFQSVLRNVVEGPVDPVFLVIEYPVSLGQYTTSRGSPFFINLISSFSFIPAPTSTKS